MSVLTEYFSNLPTKKYKKGEHIFLQGEVPRYAYGVKSGVIKIYSLTANGEEKCLSYEVEGGIFPVCWTFSKTDSTLYYYRAHTDCELGVIDKPAFNQALHREPNLMYETLQAQMSTYVQFMLRINSLEQQRASVKLLNTFRLLCLKYGTTIREHVVRIDIPLTQQEIAQFTGLTRETTTTELKRLKQSGVISCESKHYTVYTSKLNDLIDDDFNPGIYI